MMPPSCLSATQNKTERTWRDPEMRGGEQRDGNSIAAATQGLDAKKNQPSLPKGEVFLLDIPFYRTRRMLNQTMFARKVRAEYQQGGQRQPCPLKWLDSFSMRNFTNASIFDDTLPVADGAMEIGARVPLDQLQEAMEDWFRRKSYLLRDASLVLTEENSR
jgi:hypothetical protein